VASCRFLGGRIHEIGVSFIERVHVGEFCGPEARVVSDDTPKPPEEPKPLSGVVVACPGEAERVLTVSRLRTLLNVCDRLVADSERPRRRRRTRRRVTSTAERAGAGAPGGGVWSG